MTCVVPLHQIWSSASCLFTKCGVRLPFWPFAAISANFLKPQSSLRTVPHPRVPDTFCSRNDNVKSKKQRCYPGNRTPDLPITRWLFCPFKLSSLFFSLTLNGTLACCPPTLLSYYRISAYSVLIMTFLFLLNALTAELRRPSSRQRESNS